MKTFISRYSAFFITVVTGAVVPGLLDWVIYLIEKHYHTPDLFIGLIGRSLGLSDLGGYFMAAGILSLILLGLTLVSGFLSALLVTKQIRIAQPIIGTIVGVAISTVLVGSFMPTEISSPNYASQLDQEFSNMEVAARERLLVFKQGFRLPTKISCQAIVGGKTIDCAKTRLNKESEVTFALALESDIPGSFDIALHYKQYGRSCNLDQERTIPIEGKKNAIFVFYPLVEQPGCDWDPKDSKGSVHIVVYKTGEPKDYGTDQSSFEYYSEAPYALPQGAQAFVTTWTYPVSEPK